MIQRCGFARGRLLDADKLVTVDSGLERLFLLDTRSAKVKAQRRKRA